MGIFLYAADMFSICPQIVSEIPVSAQHLNKLKALFDNIKSRHEIKSEMFTIIEFTTLSCWINTGSISDIKLHQVWFALG